jgi:hypothetical protein
MKRAVPPDIQFYPGPRLMVYRPRGVLTENRVNAIIEFLEKEEDEAEGPFNRFTDLTKVDALDLGVNAMIRISLHRRLAYGNHPPVKSAFYVTGKTAANLVKVHIRLTSPSPIKVRMFGELEAAAKWLGVLPELLELDATTDN